MATMEQLLRNKVLKSTTKRYQSHGKSQKSFMEDTPRQVKQLDSVVDYEESLMITCVKVIITNSEDRCSCTPC